MVRWMVGWLLAAAMLLGGTTAPTASASAGKAGPKTVEIGKKKAAKKKGAKKKAGKKKKKGAKKKGAKKKGAKKGGNE